MGLDLRYIEPVQMDPPVVLTNALPSVTRGWCACITLPQPEAGTRGSVSRYMKTFDLTRTWVRTMGERSRGRAWPPPLPHGSQAYDLQKMADGCYEAETCPVDRPTDSLRIRWYFVVHDHTTSLLKNRAAAKAWLAEQQQTSLFTGDERMITIVEEDD